MAVNYSLRRRKENEPENKQRSVVETRALARSVVDRGSQRVSFLTEIMDQLWEYINVAGGDMIRDTLEPMLVDMTPAITVAKMDLGTIPLRMDNIVVHDIQDGAVKFDMDIIWDGECDIQLKAKYVGSFGVKSVKLKGRMSILLKPLTNELPIVSAIQYAFINPPDLKLNFTGLAQLADIKVIHNSIRKILQDSIDSMLVLPNRMLYKMNSTNDFMDTYQPPIGIVYITVVEGRGFPVEKKYLQSHDVPDVYCNISLSASEVWRTRTVKDGLTPEWKETHGFLLSDHGQIIRIHAWDEDTGTLDSDDELGTAQLVIGELLLAGRTMEVELQMDGVGTGAFVTLHANVCELTPNLTSLDSLEEKTLCGLLTILVTRAFDISLPPEKAACFVKVTCGSFEFVTSAVRDYPGVDALNPVYDCAFHVPLTGANSVCDIHFTLMNGEDSLGTTTVTAASLVDSTDKTITETRPIGDDGSSLELRVMLRGVQNANAPEESMSPALVRTKMAPVKPTIPTPVKPIGTVRITAKRGRGFKAQKQLFRKYDFPDVYCNIEFGSVMWKTATIRNSVTPEWNESKEFVLSNQGQSVSIDVFDEDKTGADELLGSVRVTVSRLLFSGAVAELELESEGKGTGAFLTLACDMVNPNVRK
jgi:Ca2+-dependent lipid-binding protein